MIDKWKILEIRFKWDSLVSKKISEAILFSLPFLLLSPFPSIFIQMLIGGSKSILQMTEGCSALPRSIDEVLADTHVEQSRGSARRNRLIKMLIARLVRRPPAMSARSSARGRLAGSLWVFAFKLSFLFLAFLPLSFFFPPFRSIIYRPMARNMR